MKDSSTRGPGLFRIREAVQKGFGLFRGAIQWYNRRLSRVYSPNLAALAATALVLVVAVVILFVPPYIGAADDGSLSDIMRDTGLSYRRQDLEYPTGAYFVRQYLHTKENPQGFSTHRMIIRAAIWLDTQFTHDQVFDIRFLAGLYLVFYLPAVFLVLRGIVSRVKVAAEATFLTVFGALVLGDAVVIAHFNSLYPEAVWQILLMYCFGFCMALQHEKPVWELLGFMGLTISGSLLAMTESHCAVVGAVLAVFCVRQAFREDRTRQTSTLALAGAIAILAASGWSLYAGATRFTESSRLHALTNGVLMRSQNPADTLEELHIDPRFEILTDTSSYADYPVTLVGNPEIQRDLISRYSTGSIVLYYMRHPLSFIGLLETGVQACFSSLRSYVGSYEASTGLPPRARNPLFIFYSNFRANSLPRTLDFILVLAGVYLMLFRRKRGLQKRAQYWTPRERQVMLDTFFCVIGVGIADISTVLVLSGTAEIERYQMLCGACVDGMILLFLAEILHRLNILSEEG